MKTLLLILMLSLSIGCATTNSISKTLRNEPQSQEEETKAAKEILNVLLGGFVYGATGVWIPGTVKSFMKRGD